MIQLATALLPTAPLASFAPGAVLSTTSDFALALAQLSASPGVAEPGVQVAGAAIMPPVTSAPPTPVERHGAAVPGTNLPAALPLQPSPAPVAVTPTEPPVIVAQPAAANSGVPVTLSGQAEPTVAAAVVAPPIAGDMAAPLPVVSAVIVAPIIPPIVPPVAPGEAATPPPISAPLTEQQSPTRPRATSAADAHKGAPRPSKPIATAAPVTETPPIAAEAGTLAEARAPERDQPRDAEPVPTLSIAVTPAVAPAQLLPIAPAPVTVARSDVPDRGTAPIGAKRVATLPEAPLPEVLAPSQTPTTDTLTTTVPTTLPPAEPAATPLRSALRPATNYPPTPADLVRAADRVAIPSTIRIIVPDAPSAPTPIASTRAAEPAAAARGEAIPLAPSDAPVTIADSQPVQPETHRPVQIAAGQPVQPETHRPVQIAAGQPVEPAPLAAAVAQPVASLPPAPDALLQRNAPIAAAAARVARTLVPAPAPPAVREPVRPSFDLRPASVAVTPLRSASVPQPIRVVEQPAAAAFAAQLFAAAAPARDPDASDPIAELTAAFPLAGLTGAAPAPEQIAAPAAAQDVPLDLADDSWMTGMIDRIETLRDASGGNGEARIRLTPDALGGIDVAITRDDTGALQVQLSTETPQARIALAEAAPRLADMAEARGLKLGNTGVDAGTGQPGQERRESHQPTPARPRPADGRAETLSQTIDHRIA